MPLIGLAGPKKAGKDTAFLSIQDWAERRGLCAARRGFADKLKISAAYALGYAPGDDGDEQVLIELMDEMKENGLISSQTGGSLGGSTLITGRQYLQFYGTEAHRDVFGSSFWVDQVLPLGGGDRGEGARWPYVFGNPPPQFCVVTDVRFPNEAERIKYLGGMVWEIDAYERLGINEAEHTSEQRLPRELVDEVIDNNGTPEQFRAAVIALMVEKFHMAVVNGVIQRD